MTCHELNELRHWRKSVTGSKLRSETRIFLAALTAANLVPVTDFQLADSGMFIRGTSTPEHDNPP
jgi:hypothetical protein